jgi:maleate isomerase
MTLAPYQLDPATGAALGLIVLQVDETLEQDFRTLFPAGATRVFVSRIPSGAALNPDTIRRMEADLPAAAALLPPAAEFNAVGYACTSGASLIGPARVSALVSGACRAQHVTDPLTAALAAFRAMGVTRVAILSPYIPSVARTLRDTLESNGVTVPQMRSFGEEVEANVARISPRSIIDAAHQLAQDGTAQAVFMSCTNLPCLDLIPDLEASLGLPVLSSNQVLAWHMSQIAGCPVRPVGRLLATDGAVRSDRQDDIAHGTPGFERVMGDGGL